MNLLVVENFDVILLTDTSKTQKAGVNLLTSAELSTRNFTITAEILSRGDLFIFIINKSTDG